MKNYHKFLLEMKWERDWDIKTISQYSFKDLLMNVCESSDVRHEFAVCPKKHFDRWANSRHINFQIMVANNAWIPEKIEKDFKQKVTDAIWLCKTLKPRMFNQFIYISY